MASGAEPVEPEDEVFLGFGMAMSTAQALEGDLLSLSLAVGAHAQGGATPAEFKDLDSQLSKRTLGQLLGFLKAKGYLDRSSHAEWFAALELRNYLAHGFFIENVEKMLVPEGCIQLASELREVDAFLERIQDQVRETLPRVIAALGLDVSEFRELVAREYEKIIEAERGLDNGGDELD